MVPNTVVALALGQAQPSNPKLDDKTPLLRSEPNGFTVQVEKPGDHLLRGRQLVIRLLAWRPALPTLFRLLDAL